MANKIIETNLPSEVIETIDRHLTKAETKHPFFAKSIIPVRLCNPDSIKVMLGISRIDRERTQSVYDVLVEEFCEIFEAVQRNDLINARQEIYDTIAVLLRLDKVLQEKQRNEDFKRNDIPLCGNN